jgi:hypothetical protein
MPVTRLEVDAARTGSRPRKRLLARCRDNSGEELPDPAVDFIADAADDLGGLAGGVLELPVLTPYRGPT